MTPNTTTIRIDCKSPFLRVCSGRFLQSPDTCRVWCPNIGFHTLRAQIRDSYHRRTNLNADPTPRPEFYLFFRVFSGRDPVSRQQRDVGSALVGVVHFKRRQPLRGGERAPAPPTVSAAPRQVRPWRRPEGRLLAVCHPQRIKTVRDRTARARTRREHPTYQPR
jgi:hypothetical protein